MTIASIALLALSTAASAADKDRTVSGVIGSYAANDPAFELVSPMDALGVFGLRVEYGLTDRFTLAATGTRKRVATAWYDSHVEGSPSIGSGESFDDPTLMAGFLGQQVTIGPKVMLFKQPDRLVNGYFTAQGLAYFGTLRLDDDFTREDNPNQYVYRGWAPGFVTALGAEAQVLPRRRVRPTAFLEMGYSLTGQMAFSDENVRDQGRPEPVPLGDLQFRGFYLQSGIGVRF